MTSPRGGSRTVGKRLIGDNAAHDHAAARDHCGGNHLFAGRPIYVQRQELEDARTEDDYTIREWVEAPGMRALSRRCSTTVFLPAASTSRPTRSATSPSASPIGTCTSTSGRFSSAKRLGEAWNIGVWTTLRSAATRKRIR